MRKTVNLCHTDKGTVALKGDWLACSARRDTSRGFIYLFIFFL